MVCRTRAPRPYVTLGAALLLPPLKLLLVPAAAEAVLEAPGAGAEPIAVGLSASLPPALGLGVFDDADCLTHPGSELLLELLTELCEVLEGALAAATSPADTHWWTELRAWGAQQGPALFQLSSAILAGAYCEPGKAAMATATCILLLGDPADPSRQQQAHACSEDVDALLQATAKGEKNMFDTRLHMFLRSPWPAFRLLHLFVRLFPSDEVRAEVDLGRCRANEDIEGKQVDFDWPWFRESLVEALGAAASRPELFALNPSDGPLSEQYRARWTRVYQVPEFREAAAFGSAAFYEFRRRQWAAGCHPAIVSAYLMQVVTFCIRDSEAWLQRYVGAAWRLLNMLTPVPILVRTDWPIFQALHVAGMLRRHPAAWSPSTRDAAAPRLPDGLSAAEALQRDVREALSPPPAVAYVTAVWGSLSAFVGHFLSRWRSLAMPLLVFLALDAAALPACVEHDGPGVALACIPLHWRFGLEASVAKYVALSVATHCGALAVWLDFDVYLAQDPTALIHAPFLADESLAFALAGHYSSPSLNPAIVAAKGAEASAALLRYAAWLHEHPYILDHQGWDAFLQHREGDFSGSWDYKGRNISSAPNDGLQFSFAPPPDQGLPNVGPPRYMVLGPEFANGDGFAMPLDSLVTFHFWGAEERQEELFRLLYPYSAAGFAPAAGERLAACCLRRPAEEGPEADAARAQSESHLTAISYADGCCEQSVQRNRRSALEVGVDDARAYGREDLDPEWAAVHAEVLSQRKGAGWWLWKPRLVLQTLLDDAVPWYRGVVLWLDAGNFFVSDPQPAVARALRESDVAAMRLKCCVEGDWTSAQALRKLGGTGYAIADRPQLGAYFIMLRKTRTAVAFVQDWLRFAEDPEVLLESGGSANMRDAPGYQRHMADQSIFSVLFKQWGFKALSLEEGHKVVQLDRWRE